MHAELEAKKSEIVALQSAAASLRAENVTLQPASERAKVAALERDVGRVLRMCGSCGVAG